MDFDIKSKIEEIVEKVKSDKDFAAKFTSDPIKAVESLVGTDLPDEKIQPIVDGVKAMLAKGDADGLLDKAKHLFKK